MKFLNFSGNLIFILPVFSSVLLILSYPPSYSRWLIFFALIPLLIFLEKASKKQAFWGSFVFGFIFLGWTMSWIFTVLPLDWAGVENPLLGMSMVAIVWLLSILTLSFFVGMFGFFGSVTSPLWRVLTIPSLWILFEYTRAFAFGVFTMGSESLLGPHWTLGALGYALSNFPVFLQFSKLFGLYGMSFLVVVINLAFFFLLFKRKRVHILQVGFFGVIMMSLIWYGTFQFSLNQEVLEEKKVALVQTDFIFGTTSSFEQQRKRKISEELLRNASQFSPELVVLPESSPIPNEYGKNLPRLFSDVFGNEKSQTIIANQKIIKGRPSPARIFFYDTKKGLIAVKDKKLLIPGGEHLPYLIELPMRLFGFDKSIAQFNSRRARLKGENVPIAALDSQKRPEGILLCSTVFAPSLWRELTLESTQIFVNIANLSLFQHSPLLIGQIESQIKFFAASHDRWFLQSANGGFSYIIDNKGVVREKSNSFGNTVLIGEVEYRQTITPFSRTGDWPVMAAFLFLVALPKRMWQIRKAVLP